MDLRRVAAVQFARVLADLGTAALALPTLGLTFYRLRCAYDAAQDAAAQRRGNTIGDTPAAEARMDEFLRLGYGNGRHLFRDHFVVHGAVLRQSALVVADVCVGALLVAIHALALWRVPFLWRDIYERRWQGESWRRVVLRHCGTALLEAVSAPLCALTIILIPYRARRFIGELRESRDPSRRKSLGRAWYSVVWSASYGGACFHPATWAAFPLYFLCAHRLLVLHRWVDAHGDTHQRCVVALWETARLAVLDIVALFAGGAVLATGWRARALVVDLSAVRARQRGASRGSADSATELCLASGAAESALEAHRVVASHFLLAVRDAPYLMLLLLCVLLPWRLPHLRRRLAAAAPSSSFDSCSGFAARVSVAIQHVVRGVADVPCALLIALLCCTWRVRVVTTFVPAKWRSGTLWVSLHPFAVRQLAGAAIDVPFIVAAPLALWRLPVLVGAAWDNEGETAASLRMLVAKQIALTLGDVVCGVLVLPALCTWRSGKVWALLRSDERSTRRLLVLAIGELVQCIFDAPFILIAPLCLWRLPAVIAQLMPAPRFVDAGLPLLGDDATVALVLPPEKSMTGQGTMDGHGLRLVVHGSLRPGVRVDAARDAKMRIVSDALWSALDRLVAPAIIRLAKLALHPLAVTLTPGVDALVAMTSACASASAATTLSAKSTQNVVHFELELGTGSASSRGPKISHATMFKAMRQLNGEEGDPNALVSIELSCDDGSGGGDSDDDSALSRCCNRTPRATLVQFKFSAMALLRARLGSRHLVVVPTATPEPQPPSAMEVRMLVLHAVALVVVDCVAALLIAPLLCTWRARHVWCHMPTPATLVAVFALKQLAQCVVDVAALLAAFALLALPWRFVALARALCRRGLKRCDATMRRSVFRALGAALVDLPLEAAAFACSVSAPWRLPRFVRALISSAGAGAGAALRRKQRQAALRAVALAALADDGALLCAAVICLTVWRVPAALADMQRVARNANRGQPLLLVRFPLPTSRSSLQIPRSWFAHRRAALQLLRHVCCLPLDVLAVLQALFVALTLVSVPHCAVRLHAFRKEWVRAGSPGFPQVRPRRWCADARALCAQLRRESRDSPAALPTSGTGFFDRPSVVPQRVLQYCDAASMCAIPTLAKRAESWWWLRWVAQSESCTLWQCLAERDFARPNPNGAAVPTRSPNAVGDTPGAWKAEYARLAAQRRTRRIAQPTAAERDYDAGLRAVVQSEFVLALTRLPHLLVLPLKIIGALTLPFIVWLIRLRRPWMVRVRGDTQALLWFPAHFGPYGFLHRFPYRLLDERNDANGGSGPISGAPLSLIYSTHLPDIGFARKRRDIFWTLHSIAVMNALLLFELLCAELAALLGIAYVALVQITTLGAALWSHALGISFAAVGGDVFLGMALPALVLFAAIIVLAPNLSWLPFIGTAFKRVAEFGVRPWSRAMGKCAELLAPLRLAAVDAAIADFTAPLLNATRGHIAQLQVIGASAYVAITTFIDEAPSRLSTAALFPLVQAALPEGLLANVLAPMDWLLSFELSGVRRLYAASRWATFDNRVTRWLFRWAWWVVKWRLVRQWIWMCWVAGPCFTVAETILKRIMPQASPLYIYRIPLRLARAAWRLLLRVASAVLRCVHGLWRLYVRVLAAPTRWSNKQTNGRLREVVLVPYTFAWITWPLLALFVASGSGSASSDEVVDAAAAHATVGTVRVDGAVWQLTGVVVFAQLYLAKGVVTKAWYGQWEGVFGTGIFRRWV